MGQVLISEVSQQADALVGRLFGGWGSRNARAMPRREVRRHARPTRGSCRLQLHWREDVLPQDGFYLFGLVVGLEVLA